MGPGCFYPGNGITVGVIDSGTHASMGPGCFYPGNAVTSSTRLWRQLLQWGRDVSIPEISA